MSKTKTIRVSDEELAALQAFRASKGEEIAGKELTVDTRSEAHKELAEAFIEAIERTKPVQKKTVANRKKGGPWVPPDGTPRLKMKRKFYQHGLLIQDNVTNDTIALLNRVKPGRYCDGWVQVNLRKDRGIDITYPIRTAAQRLKLVNVYGIRGFDELLQRVIDEAATPAKYRKPEDNELYDLE